MAASCLLNPVSRTGGRNRPCKRREEREGEKEEKRGRRGEAWMSRLDLAVKKAG